MSRGLHPLSKLLLATALVSSVAGIACGDHHEYRAYDPYYTDYHTWDNNEVVYYNQLRPETHRDPHRDYHKMFEGRAEGILDVAAQSRQG